MPNEVHRFVCLLGEGEEHAAIRPGVQTPVTRRSLQAAVAEETWREHTIANAQRANERLPAFVHPIGRVSEKHRRSVASFAIRDDASVDRYRRAPVMWAVDPKRLTGSTKRGICHEAESTGRQVRAASAA